MTRRISPLDPVNLGPVAGPKSWCRCGHTGDGPHSQHAVRLAEGHGACQVRGCYCKQFTWDGWLQSQKRRHQKGITGAGG